MSSKRKLIYLIVAALLLLLVSIRGGLAVSENFNAYASKNTVYACSCSLTEQQITVENTGDVISTFGISQEGTGAIFSSLTENSFSLDIGKSKTITNFIKAPCNAEGTYDLKTNFETIFGMKKEFSQKIEVKDCVNVDIKMKEASVPVCPCSPAKYVFTIQNTGAFLETYSLSIDSSYAAISENILLIEPQKSQDVTVFITTPCGDNGNIGFTLNAHAENSDMIAELPFNLQVAPCYNYTMEALSQYSVCKDVNNIIPVTIKNTADIANSYFLSTNADWAVFENSSIDMWGKESKNINLNVYPVNIDLLNYNLTIDAITSRGEIQRSMGIGVNVENCYSLKLGTESDYFQVVEGEASYVTTFIENDGTRANDYELNFTGPDWIKLESTRINLAANASKQIKLNYNAPANTSGSYEGVLSATIAGYPEKTASIRMKFDIFEIEQAYNIQIDALPEDLDTNYDGKTIPVTLTNNGIRKGEYDIVLTGTNWSKLDRSKVTINPQESDTIGVVLTPTNDTSGGKYGLTIDVILKNSNIAYSRTFDVKLRQKTLWEKITGFFADYWMVIAAAAVALIILVLMIIGARNYRKKHPKEEKVEPVEETRFIEEEKTGGWKRWLILLLILLILAGAGFASYYFGVIPMIFGNATNATNETTEIGVPEIPEIPEVPEAPSHEQITNATIFVNRTGLSGYGNVIEVSPLENITIPLIIQNSDEPNTYIIKVRKDVLWVRTDKEVINIPPSRKETVYIFVEPTPDVKEGNYNLSISIDIAGRQKPISEEIVLSLVRKEPFYMQYKWYLIAGAAALILLLILLRARDRKDSKEFEDIEKSEYAPTEEAGVYEKIKKFLVIIVLALLILALIGLGVYYGMKMYPSLSSYITKGENATSNITQEQEVPSESEIPELPQAHENKTTVEEIAKETYEEVLLVKGTETLIPIKITNVNKTSSFKISINENVDWLNVNEENIDIAPGEEKTINLIASPGEAVENGDYKVTVGIKIDEGRKLISKNFVLKVRNNQFDDLWSYLYYIIAGIVVLLVAIALLRNKGKKEEEPEKEDKKQKRKKTDIKI